MSEAGQVEQAARQVVNAAIIRPGDTLIIATDYAISADDADYLREEIKERLDVNVCLIEHVAGLAVYRPDPGDQENPG